MSLACTFIDRVSVVFVMDWIADAAAFRRCSTARLRKNAELESDHLRCVFAANYQRNKYVVASYSCVDR